MHDVVALAERLLALPTLPKVASAPEVVPSKPGTHQHAVDLRKIAHAIRAEGLTVEDVTIDDVLSGEALSKVASDEASSEPGRTSTHPLAIEMRELAAELRKFASDTRRQKIASLERELEAAVIAEHEKRASEYVTGHPPAGSGANPQHTSVGPGAGTMLGLGVAGAGGYAAYPHFVAAMKGDDLGPTPEQDPTKGVFAALAQARKTSESALASALAGPKPEEAPTFEPIDHSLGGHIHDSLAIAGKHLHALFGGN